MISLDTSPPGSANIRVIGVGGGGGNAINNMIARGLQGVDFIAANTDKQALDHNLAQISIQLGKETTRGLGAGADPEVGRISVEENMDEIKETLKGSDMIFVTGGMGGGTGTGGAPIIAKIGQELGALVVGIVTKPFIWEGRKRIATADHGISQLRQHVDALIVIPNQKLLDIIDKTTSFPDAFKKVDEVLYNATRGIADIISRHGIVNVDFADVRTVMKSMGDAIMGIGTASSEHRATEATHNALNSPLLDGISISGAKGVLVNISGGKDMTMHEVADAVRIVEEAAGEDVNLIHGVVYSDEPLEELMVTVVATGFNKHEPTIQLKDEGKEIVKTVDSGIDKRLDPQRFKTTIGVDSNTISPVQQAAARSYAINEIVNSPRGDQLKKYDRPAFERRGKMPENGNGTNGSPEHEESQLNGTVLKSKLYDQPAFLRRIMD